MGLGKIAVFVLIGLTAAQTIIVIPSMFSHEEYIDYKDNILPFVLSCDLDQYPEVRDQPTRNPLKYWLHCASFNLTGYPNTLLIPFAIGLLPLTYYLGYFITNDKRVGIVAISAMIINPYYALWASSGTYDQVWAFFLLLSVVLIFRKQGTSIASYVVSIAGKTMALAYFPMWVYTHWKVNKNRSALYKILILSMVLISSVFGLGQAERLVGSPIGFFPENLAEAATANISTFWMILPILIGLVAWNKMAKAKEKTQNKNLVLLWIIGVFVMTILIHIFTQQQTYGYRYAPLAAFISVYVGQVAVETINHLREQKSLYKPQA